MGYFGALDLLMRGLFWVLLWRGYDEIGPRWAPADVLMNDGKTLGVGPDLKEDAIQIVPKGEVQAVGFVGVPVLSRQDVPLRR